MFFLRIQGFVLGAVHCTFGVLAVIMSILTDDFNTTFPLHYTQGIWVNCKTFIHESINVVDHPLRQLRIRDFCNATTSDKVMAYAENTWFDVQFGWFVSVYFLWTGLFHLFYVTFYWSRYSECIEVDKSRFYLRWLEYAGSSSIMMLLIVYFLGITNVVLLVAISVAIFFIVLLPYVVRRGKGPEYLAAVIAYIVIWSYLFVTFIVENYDYIDNIPWFV